MILFPSVTHSLDGKTPAEARLMARAINAITEYRMIRAGVATYASLGYGNSRIKLLEWLAIDSAVEAAYDEDRKRKGGR